ncbi:MAG: hypothetical protein HOL15_01455, partial [Nitrospinaceae bacterium]|nr:hypothetical protein [Nitrospinaceae bacterium]
VGTTGGQAVFLRTTVSIETGATTMNSSPLVLNNRSTTTYSGSIDGKSYYGRSSTSEPPTIIVPNTPEPNYVDGGTHKISLNIDKLPVSFVVLGTTITVLEAKQYSARVILNN